MIKVASDVKATQVLDNISVSNVESSSPNRHSEISSSPLHPKNSLSARKGAASVEPVKTKVLA